MNLYEYPRPPFDTGIGIHWCAGISHVSTAHLRSFWLPQLEELGISWVKIADQRRALPLVEELLAAGIMPIVQIRRPAVNPGHLGSEQLREVEALIDAGVCYFEFNSRPDAPSTWLREDLPPNAPALIAEHTAIDLEEILARGGLPAIPALSPGSKWDLVRALVELGRKDLLAGPIWQAIHNFGSNRPLNYPHDPGNRDGAPLTQEYYLALAQEGWNADAWQGQDLETINRLRWQMAGEGKPAGISLPPDRLCWLDYERLDARNQILLGRSLPILSTSGGWIVGKADDPRYPAVTPLLHLAQTLEACRVMMGTSRRYAAAPDYYFCTAFWLLANEALESDRPVLEEEAWYSHLWPQQTLPVVPALKVEPKRTRLPQWSQPEQMDLADLSDLADPAGRVDVAMSLRAPEAAANSVIAGHVRGGAGASLWLVRSDGVLYRTIARADGTYRFVDLARGRYTLWVDQPPGSRREHIELDGHNKVDIRLTVDRWGYEVARLNDTETTTLRCRVESSAVTAESGTLAIRLRRSDDTREHGSRVMPMARRADGTTGCEFPTLASGEYRVEVLGVTTASGDPHPVEALIDLNGPTQLTFVFNRPYERGYLQLSQIYGQVTNGWGKQIMLVDSEGKRRYEEIDGEDRYQFEMLPPGLYTLAIVGREQSEARNRLALDGRNQLQINFTIYEGRSSSGAATKDWGAVELQIPNPMDELFTLISVSGEVYTEAVELEGRVRFDHVPPGAYTLSSSSGYWQPGLEVYPNRQLTLTLPAQAPPWDWQIYTDPAEEGREGILVQVLGRQDLPLYLSDSEGNEARAYTGSVDGDPFSAWFAPLEPGPYLLIPHGLDIQAAIQLPRLTTLTVIFRRSGGLSGASQLIYTPLPEIAPATRE